MAYFPYLSYELDFDGVIGVVKRVNRKTVMAMAPLYGKLFVPPEYSVVIRETFHEGVS